MIFYSIPWSTEKDIGAYYNAFMEKIGEDDFACFVDGDACFTTTFFGAQLESIIGIHPECGLYTAVTNRLGAAWQMAGDWDSNDIAAHRRFGEELQRTKYNDICDITFNDKNYVLGGVLILINKRVWRKLGGFKTEGMLGVDNDIHWKAQAAGEKVYLMTGVYLYHWYRGGKDRHCRMKQHLLKDIKK